MEWTFMVGRLTNKRQKSENLVSDLEKNILENVLPFIHIYE